MRAEAYQFHDQHESGGEAGRAVQTKAMSDPIMMRRRKSCPVCTIWVIVVTDASVSTAELR